MKYFQNVVLALKILFILLDQINDLLILGLFRASKASSNQGRTKAVAREMAA
jgi:hypothetical protein